MFNLFKKKEEKKYKNIYELAKENCEDFEKNNDYTKYTKQAINTIEQDIAELSKQGVRKLQYRTKEFHVHADMWQVRDYFELQGFKIYKFDFFDFQFGSKVVQCLSTDIRW